MSQPKVAQLMVQDLVQDLVQGLGQGAVLDAPQLSARYMEVPHVAQLAALLEALQEVQHEMTLHPRSRRR